MELAELFQQSERLWAENERVRRRLGDMLRDARRSLGHTLTTKPPRARLTLRTSETMALANKMRRLSPIPANNVEAARHGGWASSAIAV